MNPMTRLAIVVGRQPWMPKFLPQIVWLDQTIHRLTRGRFSLLSLAGLPELFLTVRGRKSGEPRTTPLLCVPHTKLSCRPSPKSAITLASRSVPKVGSRSTSATTRFGSASNR